MFKKIIRKVLGVSDKAKPAQRKHQARRVEVAFEAHKIKRDLIDVRAIEIVETLQDAGYETYIVGGAVRDLLLGLVPKDFDIATQATPEQVKALFRRAFIIGRRFRIVHVVFGRGRQDAGLSEVFEVSTFRDNVDHEQAPQVKGNERSQKHQLEGMKHAVDSNGRVLRDNVWGDIASDAARRDFSINAMYYDPSSEVVVDYHGGIADAQQRVIRMIGDPPSRYREDPVRILRAVRFAAKLSALGFALDAQTQAPIQKLKSLLSDVPPSRMFDEMFKLLQTGHAQASIAVLKQLGLQRGVYPLLDLIVERAQDPMVHAVLSDTDARVRAGKAVVPSYLLACVLWQDVEQGWMARTQGQRPFQKTPPFTALEQSVEAVFNERIGDVSGRGKLGADMREVWMMQPRFEKRIGSAPLRLLAQVRFRAGFDFLVMRAQAQQALATDAPSATTTQLQELASWWQAFQDADAQQRQELLTQAKQPSQARAGLANAAGKPRRRRKPQAASDAATAQAVKPTDQKNQSLKD